LLFQADRLPQLLEVITEVRSFLGKLSIRSASPSAIAFSLRWVAC
jgi:hypothetical protein